MHTRFQALLLREWMQYRTGWLWLTLSGPVLAVVLELLRPWTVQPDSLVLMGTSGAITLTAMIFWLAVPVQALGLARRDENDRSIEFWMTLPVGHWASVGATLLMHLFLLPLAALGTAFLCGTGIGPILVLVKHGPQALLDVAWLQASAANAALFARMAVSLLLGILWLMPVVLVAMVASAWLKRWGLPLLAAGLAVAHVLGGGLREQTSPVTKFLGRLLMQAQSRITDAGLIEAGSGDLATWWITPQQVAGETWLGLERQPWSMLGLGLLVSAACYALLVAHRGRRHGGPRSIPGFNASAFGRRGSPVTGVD
ncbi:hypothetical protein [Methylibium rhizosphaerae]|uniref:hypothetical protein n=1 Tax=Methylibium rhizosphaerae TaxID=2570323 RepID=UPI00112B15E2|nr:hypothetical protein [Methylibium rhizosphaerae]